MTALRALIQKMIKNEGPLSVAHFMQLALTHPDHGYYISGDPLGVEGDFITAPEVSQMFGEIIGLWFADMWRQLGEPAAFTFLEAGAGRGTLLVDALRATEKVPGFHKAMRLTLIESNATFKAMQQERLAAYNPTYIDRVAGLPSIPLFFLANEFFDVLPVHQYVRVSDGWRERLVGCEGDNFVFTTGEKSIPLPLPQHLSFYELCPAAIGLAQDVAAHISKYSGAGLVIDYGYVEPSGANTLQSVSGHKTIGILEQPGEADLTVHVDFASLKLAAEKMGVFVPEVVTQGAFLKALGIELRARQLKMQGGLEHADAIASALHRLTDPSEMGTLFKVMAITPASCKDVIGFP